MSDFSARTEIKKAILTEPIKWLIGVILFYAFPLLGLLFPVVRDVLVLQIPIWALAVTVVVLLSSNWFLFRLWLHARREFQITQSDLVSEAKPNTVSDTRELRKEYEPDKKATRILIELFNANQPVGLEELGELAGFDSRNHLEYYLTDLLANNYVVARPNPIYRVLPDWYAIGQLGRKYLIDNNLLDSLE